MEVVDAPVSEDPLDLQISGFLIARQMSFPLEINKFIPIPLPTCSHSEEMRRQWSLRRLRKFFVEVFESKLDHIVSVIKANKMRWSKM